MAIQLPALQVRGLDFSQIGKGIDATVALKKDQQTNALRKLLVGDRLKTNALSRKTSEAKLEQAQTKTANKNALNALAPRIRAGDEGALEEAINIDASAAFKLEKTILDLRESGTEAENKAFEREARISVNLVDTAKKAVEKQGASKEATWQSVLRHAQTIPNFDETKLPTRYEDALRMREAGRFSIGVIEKLGKLTPARDAQGNDVFVRTNERGGVENFTASTGFRPPARKGSGLTTAQTTGNVSIADARERILDLESQVRPGKSLQDLIQERTAKFTDTGGDNKQFDPFLARDVTLAVKRRLGGDPDLAAFRGRLKQRKPVPPEPAPPPEEPGIIERAGDLLSNLFANDGEAPPSGNPETAGVAAQPGPVASPAGPQGGNHLENARDAIRRGANRQAVERRLQELGIDPRLLDR